MESNYERPVLGEVLDLGNRKEQPSWVVSFPLVSIMEISTPANGSEPAMLITVEDASTFRFTFRSFNEALSARSKLNAAVLCAADSSMDNTESVNVSMGAFDGERRRSRDSRRSRRSIAFDPVLQEEEDEDIEHLDADGDAVVDENARPLHSQLGKGRTSSSSTSSQKPAVSTKPFPTTDKTNESDSDAEYIRKWARIYASKDRSPVEVAQAARNISQRFNYPLQLDPSGPVLATKRSPGEQRALERAEIGRILPMVKEMKESADQERIRVEGQTEVTIVSPKGKEFRHFRYMCKVTGTQISPGSFEKRYRERVLGWTSEEDSTRQDEQLDVMQEEEAQITESANRVPTIFDFLSHEDATVDVRLEDAQSAHPAVTESEDNAFPGNEMVPVGDEDEEPEDDFVVVPPTTSLVSLDATDATKDTDQSDKESVGVTSSIEGERMSETIHGDEDDTSAEGSTTTVASIEVQSEGEQPSSSETTTTAMEEFTAALRMEEEQLHLAFDRALAHFTKRRRELEIQFGVRL